ncbi:MAG: trypsin-like peptidase domain-containing protein [Clostridiaceae bacterium]|nr:trypsin-like peptidase domain-containing protein [Clostridiaceae bacterium]
MRKENDYALWKKSAGRRTDLGKCAVSLTLCAALFAGTTAGAVNTTTGTASSCTCGCAACSGASISDIAESSLPFVVSITNISVQEAQQYFDRFDRYGHNQNELEETTSVGSGIIFEQTDDVLYIVTNYHVVEDATTLSVGFVDDEVYEAELCGTDEDNDLAVLKVSLDDLSADTRAAISVALFGDSDSLRVGEQVVAIGNALGYGQSVTTGIVSALNRSISTGTDAQGNTVQSTYIQTDAAINPGNSGGALLNMDGEVIGINTAKLASTEVEGMGYAIPISDVTDIIDELKTQTTTQQKTTGQQDSTPMYYFFRF